LFFPQTCKHVEELKGRGVTKNGIPIASLKHPKIGHTKQSETTNAQLFETVSGDFVLDTGGFQDTRSQEYQKWLPWEIGALLGVVKKVNGIFVVIDAQGASGDVERGNQMRGLARQVVQLLPATADAVLRERFWRSLAIVFTHAGGETVTAEMPVKYQVGRDALVSLVGEGITDDLRRVEILEVHDEGF
jgi:hypothetical protein